MLTCKNLTIIKNNKTIFKNLGFTISSQSIMLIKGRNGSGKTTLLKTIAGLIRPKQGEILWNKQSIQNIYNSYTASLAYLGHKMALHKHLSVYNYLRYWSLIRNTHEVIYPTVVYFKLTDVLETKCDDLSYGWQKRVAFSRIFLFNATIWLLDEPFTGLDSETRDLLLTSITIRKQEGVVMLTDNSNIKIDGAVSLNIEDFS